MPDESTEPLRDFSVLRTSDLDLTRETMRGRFGLDVSTVQPDSFFTRANIAELPNLLLFFASNSAPITVSTPRSRRAHVHFCLRGHATLTHDRRRVQIRPGEAFVCSTGRPAVIDLGADCEELILLVPVAMLERTLIGLTGFAPRAPLLFDPEIVTDDPHYTGLRELVLLLAGRLDPAFSVWPKATLEQIELACVSQLLYCTSHNLRRLLGDGDAVLVPSVVRVAEHFAESHCETDIGIDDMARAAGVSASTLTRAFIKHRGYSPSSYAKRVKLKHAKSLLESGAATTVVGVALRCGFANPSRFTQDYREAFGESPIETLRRRRAPRP
ncbi:MAG: AraC family transcriptional regulator [Rhodopseudomonas palustris]|uniref:AraC family transcriptional regulator n=1 Tax=Rhodopseudomonas palustris TaxID=1076 RepID=A0A933S251_RHOPL|nr:AraC family transcriptional regulator [Rhodopseudomonas palustris]